MFAFGSGITVSNFIFYCHYFSTSYSLLFSVPLLSKLTLTLRSIQIYVCSMLCWTSIPNRYTYSLSLIKGSSNFSIGLFALRFRFHFRFRLSSFCLHFDDRRALSKANINRHMSWIDDFVNKRTNEWDTLTNQPNEARCACAFACVRNRLIDIYDKIKLHLFSFQYEYIDNFRSDKI